MSNTEILRSKNPNNTKLQNNKKLQNYNRIIDTMNSMDNTSITPKGIYSRLYEKTYKKVPVLGNVEIGFTIGLKEGDRLYELSLYNNGYLKYHIIKDTPFDALKDAFLQKIPEYNLDRKIFTPEFTNELLIFLNQIPHYKGTVTSFVPINTKIYIIFNEDTTDIIIKYKDISAGDLKKCNTPFDKEPLIKTFNKNLENVIFDFYSMSNTLKNTNKSSFVTNSKEVLKKKNENKKYRNLIEANQKAANKKEVNNAEAKRRAKKTSNEFLNEESDEDA